MPVLAELEPEPFAIVGSAVSVVVVIAVVVAARDILFPSKTNTEVCGANVLRKVSLQFATCELFNAWSCFSTR